jgi:acyl-CoA thioesterase I
MLVDPTYAAIVAIRRLGLIVAAALALGAAPVRAAEPLEVVALGDSLTAGYGVSAENAFPAKLGTALEKLGVAVRITNAGVSGDTAADGLARLDWSVPDGTDAVLLELGANDMLRGQDPARTRTTLDAILTRLGERKIPVMILGMRAAPNLGTAYQQAFDAIFPALAERHGAALYPFFLDGVAGDQRLNQADGLHPNPAGVDVIVGRAAPAIAAFLKGLPPG